MELRHLRYFQAVAEEENITRAASRLRVAQPSLSRQIRDLEEELGLLLLERDARSIRLTMAGRQFQQECEEILARVEEGIKRTQAVAAGRAGEVKVGFAPSLTVELVPKTLKAFAGAMPGVRVQLFDLSTREMLQGLHDRRLDAAFLVHPSQEALRGLRFTELYRFPCSVAMNHEHPLCTKSSVSAMELLELPLIAYSQREYPEYHDWLRRIFHPLKPKPTIAEEHDSSTSLIAAVEAGHGVAIVQSDLNRYTGERLVVLPILPDAPPLIVGIACREGSEPKTVQRFVSTAAECNLHRQS